MRVSTHVEVDYKDIQDAVIAVAREKAEAKDPGSASIKFFIPEQLEKLADFSAVVEFVKAGH